MKNLKEEQQNWIRQNQTKFLQPNIGWHKEELQVLYAIYEYMLDKPVKRTSCNRCIRNIINVVWKHYTDTTSSETGL